MIQIVITGATGFTGSHVLEAFQKNPSSQYTVIAACRSKSKFPDSFLGDTLIGDLNDKEYINSLTAKADIICHTAAWAEMNGNDRIPKNTFLTLQLI